MRGIEQFNFPAFYAAAADLRAKGHTVISPADHDEEQGFDPSKNTLDGFDLKAVMRWDIAAVLSVEAVVVLPDWRSSHGTQIEVGVANAIGTPVLEYSSLEPVKESVTQEANRLVNGPRQNSYGHPFSDFSRTGRMWGAILGIPDVEPAKVGLCMAAVKISREVNAPKRDNLVDLAGYAETVSLVRQKENS